jgi:phosphonopyruvate decarboxylase
MIEPGFFFDELSRRGTDFFTGVPDSLLKSFCAYLADYAGARYGIAVNEGAAVALAAGYHLATGGVPLVYMQNSGLGNAANPLLSLTDPDVYRIPLILLIGWRGEPGVHDEPQHVKQGKVTGALLEAMGIPHAVLAADASAVSRQLDVCYRHLREQGAPYAFVVRKDTFSPYISKNILKNDDDDTPALSREAAIAVIVRVSGAAGVFVATTGMASRELYELREKLFPAGEADHSRDFLTVGSMGHASSIALALALHRPGARITCLDGDGAALMHLGALAAIGEKKPRNLRHIVLNNGAHDSVGGQPTIARSIDLPAVARACGYARVYSVRTAAELERALEVSGAPEASGAGARERAGPVFIEVLVRKGARSDLGRPKSSPEENQAAFMNALRDEEGEAP